MSPTLEDQIAAASAEVEANHASAPKTGIRKKTAPRSDEATQARGLKGAASPKKTEKPIAATKQPPAVPHTQADRTSNLGWKNLLQTDKKGDYLGSTNNMRLILTHDPNWKGVLAYDHFIGDIVTLKLPPWPKDMQPIDFKSGDFTDKDTWRTKCWLEQSYNMNAKLADVGGALQVVSDRVYVHPVRDFLEALRWDKVPRLHRWLVDMAGAEDTPYAREVGKNFLIGAVARIYEPGCQVDSMPVFEGPQGAGKSTMVSIIGGDWFYSSQLDISNKDAYQNLKRKWIVEMGELDALGRAEVSHIKQFISQRVDTYRSSYARRAADHPRQFVFCGTVNPEDGTGYLKDNTGARRFWPIAVGFTGPIRLDLIKKLRGQLLAEAVALYKAGEEWHFTDAGVIKAAGVATESRRQVDPWEEIVARWLKVNRSSPGDRKRGVTTHDILKIAFEMEVSKITRNDEMRVAGALRMVGWTDVARETRVGVTTRVYRPSAATLIAIEGGRNSKDVSSTEGQSSTQTRPRAVTPEPSRTGISAKDISSKLDTGVKNDP